MFNSQIAFPVTATMVANPADGETYSVWKAPFSGEVIDLWAVLGASVAHGDGTGLAIVLQNGGQVGTSTTAIGTVGSGTLVSWTADTVKAGSVGAATFVAGDVLAFKFDETSDLTVAWLNVGFNVRCGPR